MKPEKLGKPKIKYVDVSAVSKDTLSINGWEEYVPSEAPGRARKVVRLDDTIVATIRPGLRRIAAVPKELDDEFVSTAFCVLRADPNKLVPLFLYYWCLGSSFTEQLISKEKGASYPAVTDSEVLEEVVRFPRDVKIQQGIASTLSLLQSSVENADKQVATLRELKAATLAKVMREGLRGERLKETEIGEVPESWSLTLIGGLGEVITGTTPSTSRSDYYGGNTPFVAPGDLGANKHVGVTAKTLTRSGAEVSRRISAGSTLVVCIGATIGKVGLTTCEVVTNQQINAVVPGNGFDSEFLYYLLLWNSNRIKDQSSPGPLPILNKSVFENMKILVPTSAKEIKDITGILSEIDRSIDSALALANRKSELFSSTLSNLFDMETI
jgi:type I restriction enzyme S subunit